MQLGAAPEVRGVQGWGSSPHPTAWSLREAEAASLTEKASQFPLAHSGRTGQRWLGNFKETSRDHNHYWQELNCRMSPYPASPPPHIPYISYKSWGKPETQQKRRQLWELTTPVLHSPPHTPHHWDVLHNERELVTESTPNTALSFITALWPTTIPEAQIVQVKGNKYLCFFTIYWKTKESTLPINRPEQNNIYTRKEITTSYVNTKNQSIKLL